MRTGGPVIALLFLMLLVCAACAGGGTGGDSTPPPAGLKNGSFTEQVGGRLVHYEVHGEGPVMITVPNSWGLSLEGVRGLFQPLERQCTMVYFDPRGMGGSAPVSTPEDMSLEAVREDWQALREHLGLEKAHALGWSNGAMNLILLAEEHPEHLLSAIVVHGVARFVPEDMAAIGAEHPELFRDFGALQQELAASEAPVEEKTARMKAFWLERYFPEISADHQAVAPKLLEVFEPAQFSYEHAQFSQERYPSFDASKDLARIDVPLLAIAGRHDMMRVDRVKEVADGAPRGQFELFENSGHFAPIEEQERFYEVVRTFLAETMDGSEKSE